MAHPPLPPERPRPALRGVFAFHDTDRAGASGEATPGAPVHPRKPVAAHIAIGFAFAVLGFFLVAVVRALAS